MKNIIVIGAGQLGSRHLQALKKSKFDSNIYVVDPNLESLELSRQRYEQISEGSGLHSVCFLKELTDVHKKQIDLAIIATNSNVRFAVLNQLLSNCSCAAVVLEKVLFTKPDDYLKSIELVERHFSHAWVNCCMRQIGIYRDVYTKLSKAGAINCYVSASRFGLLTNLIHYVDYICWMTGQYKFTVDVSRLGEDFFLSKRPPFKELTGSLMVNFADGSCGHFVSFEQGVNPIVVELSSASGRYIVRETEGKAWVSDSQSNGQWSEIDAPITPQSILTKDLAESIFSSGTCYLPTLKESCKVHMNLYEPIRAKFNLSEYIWT